MLTPEDRNAIEGLFDRLSNVEREAPPRDPEAERLIDSKIGRQPSAPYYMAQTVLVQERALELAQQRIEELEQQSRRGSGLFGGLFGDAPAQQRAPAHPVREARGPWERQGAGGGFLAGAAQTALGVTGGVLLGSAIAGMFGAGAATAAEPPPEDQQGDDSAADDAGGDDLGGDFGDGGGFDMGGDF